MWQLLYRSLNCLTDNKSPYCSLLWVLFVLGCLLLFVGWSNCLSVVRLLAWINWQKKDQTESEIKTEILSGSKPFSLFTALRPYPDPHPVTSRMTFALLAFAFMLTLFSLVRAASPWPVYEYHNVQVLRQLNETTWMMKKEDGEFTAVFCRDYRPTLEEHSILEKLRYEDRGTCWSVARADLGYWKKWDAQGNLVLGDQ